MKLHSNKYDLTDNIRRYSTDTDTIIEKIFEVFWRQGELEKKVKETRDELIKTLNDDNIFTKEIEETFNKIDQLVFQISPETYDIRSSVTAIETTKENSENNIKMPWIWKKILKFLFWLEKKRGNYVESAKNKIWIKGFWTYIENQNEDWLDNMDSIYNQTFWNLYKRNVLDYLVSNDKIPTLKEMFKRTFCMWLKHCILTELHKTQFTENDYKESFWIISDYLLEKWITLEPSNNIKESFIEECKKRYPLAKNSCNHLFENKTFKNEFINKVSSTIEEDIEQVFENIYRDVIKTYRRNDTKRVDLTIWIITSRILWKYQELRNSSNRKSDMISLYFLAIADKFEEDHLKKLRKNENLNTAKQEKSNIEEENQEIQTINHNLFNTYKKTEKIDINIEEKFDKVVGIIWWNDEKRESMKRYLVNLYKKDLPINFWNFKKIFDIQEIPAKAENIILDKIGMEFEAEEEIKETKKGKDTSGEEKRTIIENTTEYIEIEDPVTYMVDQLKNMNYHFINENNFLEQANDFCKNNSQKNILKNLLYNPRFWKVLLHKAWCKDIRVLPIGRTWWRILMIKIDNTIYIDWYYNHNDYEQRLNLIKKWKVKIKTLIN